MIKHWSKRLVFGLLVMVMPICPLVAEETISETEAIEMRYTLSQDQAIETEAGSLINKTYAPHQSQYISELNAQSYDNGQLKLFILYSNLKICH